MEHKEYLTIQEVCEVLKLSRWTVSDLIKSGKIKGSKIGKSYRVERKAIDDFINDMAVQGGNHERSNFNQRHEYSD